MDWSTYAVGGAATRDDSFSGLDPVFAERAYALTQAAHAAGHPVQITSAYRSPELQAQLFERAIEKYGSRDAARKWVAPPGNSQHNHGTAIDYAINGSLLRDADSPAARWIAENAPTYGLDTPMSWEPWQVELAGARSGNVSPQVPSQASQPPQSNALAPTPQAQQQNAFAPVAAPPGILQNALLDPDAFKSRRFVQSNPFEVNHG